MGMERKWLRPFGTVIFRTDRIICPQEAASRQGGMPNRGHHARISDPVPPAAENRLGDTSPPDRISPDDMIDQEKSLINT